MFIDYLIKQIYYDIIFMLNVLYYLIMSEVRYYPSPFRRDYTRNPTIPQPIP